MFRCVNQRIVMPPDRRKDRELRRRRTKCAVPPAPLASGSTRGPSSGPLVNTTRGPSLIFVSGSFQLRMRQEVRASVVRGGLPVSRR